MRAERAAGPVTSAARQAAAIEANRKGENYVRHGELENAARSYAEALRLSQSLEDAEGIAANAINLSIVRQRQGRFADARAALGAVMERATCASRRCARPRPRCARRCSTWTSASSAPPRSGWPRPRPHCGERCPLAAIHNVRAQLSLQAGRLEAAAASARAALDASRSANDRAETANAMRILGVTALRTGDAVAARTQLEQALALDREIGARARSPSTSSPSAAPRRSAATASPRAPSTPAPSP